MFRANKEHISHFHFVLLSLIGNTIMGQVSWHKIRRHFCLATLNSQNQAAMLLIWKVSYFPKQLVFNNYYYSLVGHIINNIKLQVQGFYQLIVGRGWSPNLLSNLIKTKSEQSSKVQPSHRSAHSKHIILFFRLLFGLLTVQFKQSFDILFCKL